MSSWHECRLCRTNNYFGNSISSNCSDFREYFETNIKKTDWSILLDIPQLTQEENNILVAEFTEKEVKDAIFQMELNKSPGPDGFPAEFY